MGYKTEPKKNREKANCHHLPSSFSSYSFCIFQEDDEYIGFASLPEQVHRKAVRRGFEFTLMVVGKDYGIGLEECILTLKAPITTAADDIYKYFFIVLQRK